MARGRSNGSGDFTSRIVGVVIAVIVVGVVAIPTISELTTDPDGSGEGVATVSDPSLVTILNVIPILLMLAVLSGIAVLFMTDKKY